jgi:DNA-binding NarL/FixJ family response regulator
MSCLGRSTTDPLPARDPTHTVRIVVVVPAQFADTRAVVSQFPRAIATLVIDRQPLFVAALGSLLSGPPLSAQVISASRSDTGLEVARRGGVDVVFCDLNAQPMSGIELAHALAEEQPAVPVILLGDKDDHQQLTAALGSNASGFFTKDAGLDEFLVGVNAVLSGHRAIGAGLMERLLDRLSQQQAAQPRSSRSQLSPTELEILAMIGRAQSVPSIAASRGISNKTVRNHLARIYRKLELHGRTEAVLWAARMGLS